MPIQTVQGAFRFLRIDDIDVASLKVSLVEHSYRRLALCLHPDKGGTDSDFLQLQEARDVLLHYLDLPSGGGPLLSPDGAGMAAGTDQAVPVLPDDLRESLMEGVLFAWTLRRKHEDRQHVGHLQANLRCLRDTLPTIADHLRALVFSIAQVLHNDWHQHGRHRSWKSVGMKSFSMDGHAERFTA